MGDKLRFDKGDYAEEYEPTDSEDNYSEEEKELLHEVRNRNKRQVDSKQELLAFQESEDEDDDEDNKEDDGEDEQEEMSDSDIEGAEIDTDIPDAKDWGSKARNYYNTDFVDQDYSTYNEQEEEMAKQEEEEAKIIQMRLAKQMKEEDFQLDGDLLHTVDATDDDDAADRKLLEDSTKVKADFSGLTKRERQRLFQKDSPEFAGLIADFNAYLQEAETLLAPVLQHVHKNRMPMIPALQFAELYENILLTYCSNVAFYLLLKAKRVNVRSHPIIKRLVQLKKLLSQLKDKYDNIVRPQLDALLERILDGDQFEVLDIGMTPADIDVAAKPKRKSKLSILDQYEATAAPASKRSRLDSVQKDIAQGDEVEGNSSSDDNDEEAVNGDEEQDEGAAGAAVDDDERRGITYQIAKNKGLRIHRKKEQRNPRVKHRSKFRKALVRRKGAVRTVRKEVQRYGGEVSGIKATVSKSIKFKS